MLKFATKLFGSSNDRVLKSYHKDVETINALEATYEPMSDDELRGQTAKLRQRLADGESLDHIKYDAFAVVREAAKRTLKQRHFDVQLIGGLVMHQGKIAEMRTGEGKTLVSTLSGYLNALEGKGVHVVTVNDYLAERDSEWMGQVYNFLGLSVGCIKSNMPDEERRAAYACDITYGTNNEYGFDYLRDNMKFRLDRMVQRPFNFAIIDEIDSILIDEARTPLIISGPSESSADMYVAVNKLIPHLEDGDFDMDEKHKTVVMTEDGTERVEELLREHALLIEGNMYDIQNINLVHHVNQALRAHKLFFRDKDYIVKDDRVVLIDEFTGRMMEGRRLSEGLHQAIEAKEGADIQNENQTLASITFQNYFRLYPKLSGMTGTAMTEVSEFAEIYSLGVVAIPTNLPIARIDHDDRIYKSLSDKSQAIAALIKEAQERHQPVLVGTVSIEKSEQLSDALKKAKIKHSVLNARYHEQEAFIVAQAGRPGAVTIATNMAGRGTDIQLGGNADMRVEAEVDASWTEERRNKAAEKIRAEVEADKVKVKDAGGLFVIGTERHESRRIDNQLRGRSGRQGDPGATMFFLSVEDDLMRIFAGDRLEGLLANKRIGLQDGEALEHPLISKMLQRAQGKVESMHFDVRKNLLKYDDVMNDQRKVIYEQRREIMEAPVVDDLVKDMRHETIEDMIVATIPANSYAEQWDVDVLDTEVQRLLGLNLPVEDWAKEEGIADMEMQDRIIDASDRKMAKKMTDSGESVWRRMEKTIVLQILDQHWKEHLLHLDHLRQGINLRAFGQRDPLNEYKTEAFGMFEMMLDQLRESITQTLSLIELNVSENGVGVMMPHMMEEPQNMQETRQDPALMGLGVDRQAAAAGGGGARPQSQPVSGQLGPRGGSKVRDKLAPPLKPRRPFDKADPATWGKTPRNATCPCGSGKKFKQCHGKI